MIHRILALLVVGPVVALAALPHWRSPLPDWPVVILLSGMALALLAGSWRWTRVGSGALVRTALGWRYTALLASCVAPLATIALAVLIAGESGPAQAMPILVVQLAALQAMGGLASMVAPRNRLIGFRTPATLATDSVWIRANRRWGAILTLASPLALLGLFFPVGGTLVALAPIVTTGLAFLFIGDR